MNIDIDKLFGNLRHAHHPYVATVGTSLQSLRDGGAADVGNGTDAYEAVWNAFGSALLSGHVTKAVGWIAVVCKFRPDGHLAEPEPISQQELDALTDEGMRMALFVHEDGTI